MRVLLVNTSEQTGGAAIAANRLMKALTNFGIEVKLLVRDKQSSRKNVIEVDHNFCRKKIKFALERLRIAFANKFNSNHLFEVSIANTGYDLLESEAFQQADVIHLHWINQGFVSLQQLEKILRSGKPVVWTMHDMWAFTGICQMAGDCNKWQQECNKCPKLYRGAKNKDLAFELFYKKKNIYDASSFTIVGCSHWMAEQVRKSALLKECPILSIPNPIDVKAYSPFDKAMIRRQLNLPLGKQLILFSAFRVTDPRKGLVYFEKAVHSLLLKDRSMKNKIAVIAVGKASESLKEQFEVPVYSYDYISDENFMINIYRASDIFAIPTLFDNLPNTIMESMACGIPVVGYNVGGVSQMIDHKKNGYLAQEKNIKDFSNGLQFVLNKENYEQLSKNARDFVLQNYAEDVVAKRFYKLYKSVYNA